MAAVAEETRGGAGMDHDDLDHVVRQHPSFRLLRSDNVAMALSFLDDVFVEGNCAPSPVPSWSAGLTTISTR
jgi:hypothetical protein